MTLEILQHRGIRAFPLVAVIVCAAVLCFSATVFADSSGQPSTASTEKHYIVLLKDSVRHPEVVAQRHAENRDADVSHVYDTALNGYSAQLTPGQAQAVRSDPAVLAVGPDPRGELASQTLTKPLRRIFGADKDCDPSDNAAINANLDVDCVDDNRVDVDVAVLDSGVYHHEDLNLVAGVDCFGVDPDPDDEVAGDYTDCREGASGVDNFGHGTGIAGMIGALDNGFGTVGVAPGARIWDVRVANYEVRNPPHPWQPSSTDPDKYDFHMSDVIAGVDWVTEHADEIEVANMSMRFEVPIGKAGEAIDAALEDAIDASIAEGVVYVVAAGNESDDVAGSIPGKYPPVITASSVADFDGLPGGLGDPCEAGFAEQPDDTVNHGNSEVAFSGSNWGAGIDIAAPSICGHTTIPGGDFPYGGPLPLAGGYSATGGTSGASAMTAGAAALLASMEEHDPEDAGDVAEIGEILFGDSDCAEPAEIGEGNCNWTDDSEDGIQEPLLDVSDEAAFAPEMVTVPERGVDSDVNGDGRADLVTLRANGVVYVHPGGTDAKFGTGTTSFAGDPLDPAQYDDEGHHVIDVTDVDGDQHADLVTLADGDVHVYPSEGGLTFDEEGETSELGLQAALLEEGGHEPIAVADTTGDGYGDLAAYDDEVGEIVIYPGDSDATFSAGIEARSATSALHAGAGEYFIDAGDVTGDNRADLVSINTWNEISVFAGRSDGTLSSPTVSYDGLANPAMDDGSGFEPVGLGDVTGDDKDDLVLVNAGTIYTVPGKIQGEGFDTAKTSFEGVLTSTTFDSSRLCELFGILDVDGNGRADIGGACGGAVVVGKGQADGSFPPGETSSGSFPSTQHFKNQNSSGNEFVIEKPAFRRRGCPKAGCSHSGASDGIVGAEVLSVNPGEINVYARGADNTLRFRQLTEGGWSSWSNQGGAIFSDPGPVNRMHELVDVFARDSDNSMLQKWHHPSVGWSGWGDHSASIASAPAPVSRAEGLTDLYARGTDNALWGNWHTDQTGWSGWYSMGGTITSTPTAISREHTEIDLFARGSGGDLLYRSYSPQPGWSGWESLGGPSGGQISSGPAAAGREPGELNVFARASDGSVGHRFRTAAGWSAWKSLGGNGTSDPAAVSSETGEPSVFIVDEDGYLWRNQWSLGGWRGWTLAR